MLKLPLMIINYQLFFAFLQTPANIVIPGLAENPGTIAHNLERVLIASGFVFAVLVTEQVIFYGFKVVAVDVFNHDVSPPYINFNRVRFDDVTPRINVTIKPSFSIKLSNRTLPKNRIIATVYKTSFVFMSTLIMESNASIRFSSFIVIILSNEVYLLTAYSITYLRPPVNTYAIIHQ